MNVLSDKPCPRCLPLAEQGKLRPEMIQRLPLGAFAPRAKVPGGQPCCFDCGAADTVAGVTRSMTWEMARVAVGNDRAEQYRLPGVVMGLVQAGLVRASEKGDFEAHITWLNAHRWFSLWDGQPCKAHDECKACSVMGRQCMFHQQESKKQ